MTMEHQSTTAPAVATLVIHTKHGEVLFHPSVLVTRTVEWQIIHVVVTRPAIKKIKIESRRKWMSFSNDTVIGETSDHVYCIYIQFCAYVPLYSNISINIEGI